MSDWPTSPLGELADIRVSNVDKKSKPGEASVLLCNYMDVYTNEYINSNIGFMQSTANSIEKERFKVCRGDVIITKDSETPFDIGIPSVVMEEIDDLVCGYHLALIKPDNDKVDSMYLSKQLASSSVASYFSRMAAGSTRYGLSNGSIRAAEIPLAPRECQTKIASILETIDQAIEKTEALIRKYQQVKAGLMHDLFTRGLNVDGKLRPPREQAPELYQETPIGWIPKEWIIPTLQELCTHDITYGIVQAGPHIDGGIPYIRTGDMSGETLSKDNLLCTSRLIADSYKRSEVKDGEIVCAIRATVGKVLIVPDELNGANLTQGTARISPKETIYTPFVLWGFRSSIIQKEIGLAIKGTTFNEITLSDLRSLKFPIPKDRNEQILIAERLETCEERIVQETRTKNKLHFKKNGLMHDLLTGKVPVTIEQAETTHV